MVSDRIRLLATEVAILHQIAVPIGGNDARIDARA